MVKKFIKLHSSDDNAVIIVKIQEIILVYTEVVNDNKVTTVYFNNETIEAVTVNETPEKIYQNILDSNNAEFVKLHSSDDNAVIIVNTDSVSLITQNEENNKKITTIYFSNDSVESVTFNESPERIYQMIEESVEVKKAKEVKK